MTTSPAPRTADHPVAGQFLDRWSPRAFTGAPIPAEVLNTLFEAARWAPSSYNSQPWRFLYARRDTPSWPVFLGLLSEYNQSWAQGASALLIVLSKKTFTPPGKSEAQPARSHSFDTGAAWGFLALQANLLGWHAHGIGGFDVERTRTELKIPEDFHIEAAVAIGQRGDKSLLPERFHGGEAPNGRQPISATAFEGAFPG